MTDYKHLKVTRTDGLLKCNMYNRPEQTLSFALLGELHHLLGTIEQDETISVFVLSGDDENDIFIRWVELTEIKQLGESDPSAEIPSGPVTAIQQLSLRIQALDAVSIAAINGAVGGGGCELSLAFDFRLMMETEDATFSLPQTSFGLTPGGGGALECVRLLGRAKALDVLLHGEFMPPQQALELGLISRLYPKETYDEDVAAFAGNMAARAPLALRGVKRLVRDGTSHGQLEFYARETEELLKTITSEDAMGAIGMWLANPDLEAYKPVFKGK